MGTFPVAAVPAPPSLGSVDAWEYALAPVMLPLRLVTKVIGWLVPSRIGQLLGHHRIQLSRYEAVIAGSPAAMRLAADDRKAMAGRMKEASSRLDGAQRRIARIWQGRAARSSGKAFDRLGPKLESATDDLQRQADVLAAAAKGQESAQTRLAQVMARFDAGAATIMKSAENLSSAFYRLPVEITALVKQAEELYRVSAAAAEAVKRDLGKLYLDLAASLQNGAPGNTTLDRIRTDSRRSGTQSIFEQFVTPLMEDEGLKAGSQLRTKEHNARIGGSEHSDHLDTKTHAYATDYPTYSGEAAARKLAESMGIKDWKPDSYARHTVEVDGHRYSVQILWGKGIKHADHIHVGIYRVD